MALVWEPMPQDFAYRIARNIKRALVGWSAAGLFSFWVLDAGNRVGVTAHSVTAIRPTRSPFFRTSGPSGGVSSPARGTAPLTRTAVS